MSELAISDQAITVKALSKMLDTPAIPNRWETVPQAIAGVKTGQELGIMPMHSLAELYIINGKVAMSGKAQLALILRAGHMLVTTEMSPTRGAVTAKRRDPYTAELVDVGEYEFTWEDAERAHLAGLDTYQDYPADMLLWRAIGRASKFAFSDVCMGLMLPSELGLDPALDAADTEIGEEEKEETITSLEGETPSTLDVATALVQDEFPKAEVIEDPENG
jgi:hypothetical protein